MFVYIIYAPKTLSEIGRDVNICDVLKAVATWENISNTRDAGDFRQHRAHYDVTVTDSS